MLVSVDVINNISDKSSVYGAVVEGVMSLPGPLQWSNGGTLFCTQWGGMDQSGASIVVDTECLMCKGTSLVL